MQFPFHLSRLQYLEVIIREYEIVPQPILHIAPNAVTA
jgi:hypothetical protein